MTSPALSRFRNLALIVGVVGLVASLIGLFTGLEGFFQSYLFAYIFWFAPAAGCFVLLAVQHLAGGSWGATIRRPLEAGSMLLPLMAVLFIPVLFGMGSLYDWTSAEYLASHPIVDAKTSYLNVAFFIIRAIVYFGLFILGALYFVRNGRKNGGEETRRQMQRNSPIWIILYILIMTFAMVDWTMSLTPEWFSGIYPVTIMISQAIVAISFVIITMTALARSNPEIDQLLTTKRLQDYGNYLMAFTIFWAYTNFSQIIILWSNNIVETNTFYVLRFGLEWRAMGIFLLFFGFFGTFLILLSRWVKRKRQALTLVAIWAIVVQLVNFFYIIIPSYGREGSFLHWLDVALIVGLGGIWLWAYLGQLLSNPVIAEDDPRIAEDIKHLKAVTHG